MQQKGTEKDRIVGKNRIEGRRTDGTDGDGRRMFENKFYVTSSLRCDIIWNIIMKFDIGK